MSLTRVEAHCCSSLTPCRLRPAIKTSDHDLFAAVTQPLPVGRTSDARTKRLRRLRRVANRATGAQRAADDVELQAARQANDELRRQLAVATARADQAEADARQARQDLEAERAVTVRIRKEEQASISARIEAACAKAVQAECDLLSKRVLALQEQLVAEGARHRAERSKFAADEALHLHTAARRERNDLRRQLDKLRPRLTFPGTTPDQ